MAFAYLRDLLHEAGSAALEIDERRLDLPYTPLLRAWDEDLEFRPQIERLCGDLIRDAVRRPWPTKAWRYLMAFLDERGAALPSVGAVLESIVHAGSLLGLEDGRERHAWALSALIALRRLATPRFWHEQHRLLDRAFPVLVFRGLAAHSIAAAVQTLPVLLTTGAEAATFVRLLPSLISQHGLDGIIPVLFDVAPRLASQARKVIEAWLIERAIIDPAAPPIEPWRQIARQLTAYLTPKERAILESLAEVDPEYPLHHLAAALAALHAGDLGSARDRFRRALETPLTPELEAMVHQGLGRTYQARREFELASKSYQKALRVCITLTSDPALGQVARESAAACAYALGMLAIDQREFPRARQWFTESETLSRQAQVRQPLAASLAALAKLDIQEQAFPNAIGRLAEAQRLCADSDDALIRAQVFMLLARIRRDGPQRDLEGAKELLAQAVKFFRGVGSGDGLASLLYEQADIEARLQNIAGSAALLQEAGEVATDLTLLDAIGQARSVIQAAASPDSIGQSDQTSTAFANRSRVADIGDGLRAWFPPRPAVLASA